MKFIQLGHQVGITTARMLVGAAPTLLLVPLANAQIQTPNTSATASEVRVIGTREQTPVTRITEDVDAAPASVTTLSKRDLDNKTITTYGDIYRGVTGMHVMEYGQGLIAYGVTMRGFDEGHGRNIATYLDGMPLNVTGS